MQNNSAIHSEPSETEVLSLARDYSEITGSSIPWHHIQLIIPGTGEVLLVDVGEDGLWQAQPNYSVPDNTDGSLSVITIDQMGNAIESLTISLDSPDNTEPNHQDFTLIEPIILDERDTLIDNDDTHSHLLLPLGDSTYLFDNNVADYMQQIDQASNQANQIAGLVKVTVDGFVASEDQLTLSQNFIIPDGMKVIANANTGHLLVAGVENTNDLSTLLSSIEFVSSTESMGERTFELSVFSTEGKIMLDSTSSTLNVTDMPPALMDPDIDQALDDVNPIAFNPIEDEAFTHLVENTLGDLINIDQMLMNNDNLLVDASLNNGSGLIDLSRLLVSNESEGASLEAMLTILTEGDNTIVEMTHNNETLSYAVKTDDVMEDGVLMSDVDIIQHLIDDNQLILG